MSPLSEPLRVVRVGLGRARVLIGPRQARRPGANRAASRLLFAAFSVFLVHSAMPCQAQMPIFDEADGRILVGRPYCTGLGVGDLDNDGDNDVVAVHNFLGDYISLNDGQGHFTRRYLGNVGYRPGQTVVMDYDQDGDLDIFTLGPSYINDGTAVFTPGPGFGGNAIAMGDLNGDGFPDAIVGQTNPYGSQLFLNDQYGVFYVAEHLGISVDEYTIALGDVDNDGDLDCAIGSRLLINDGAAHFTDSGEDLARGSRPWGRAFSDLNNDGLLDLVIANGPILLNNGDATFTEGPRRLGGSYNVAVGDVNHDGFLDVVTSDQVSVYLGDGAGDFLGPVQTIYVGNAPAYDLGLADVNDDGWLDLLVSAYPVHYNTDGLPHAFINALPRRNAAPTCVPDFTDAVARFLEPSPGSFVVTEGDSITIPLTGDDPDGDALMVALTGLPPEATLTPTSGSSPLVSVVSWTPTAGDKPAAPYHATVTFTDPAGLSTMCGFTIDDINLQPSAVCGGPQIDVEATGPHGAYVQLDGTESGDADADLLAYHWDVSDQMVVLDDPSSQTPSGVFPTGVTMATLTVTDGRGGFDTCDVLVAVRDTTPPEVLCTSDVAVLWPPSHEPRTVTLYILGTDAVSNPHDITPLWVTVRSDEPDDAEGTGDGETTGDVNGADGFAAPVDVTGLFAFDARAGGNGAWVAIIQLRAERAGGGDGRCYTIDVTARDTSGNQATASCCLVVPHDRRAR